METTLIVLVLREREIGEVKELNKKILGLAVALMALAMLAAPVMAKPATKIEGVTMTAAVIQTVNPGYPRLVDHTISHSKGTSTGTVTLNIPISSGPLVLTGDYDSEWIGRGKISEDPAETEVLIMGKVVLTFTGGTFEGVIQRKIIGFPPDPPTIIPYFEDYLVLHGTGDFRGQTLKLSFAGTPPVIDEGVLIIPK
jgi:hypothetical protein